jgi:hypothetical protein
VVDEDQQDDVIACVNTTGVPFGHIDFYRPSNFGRLRIRTEDAGRIPRHAEVLGKHDPGAWSLVDHVADRGAGWIVSGAAA